MSGYQQKWATNVFPARSCPFREGVEYIQESFDSTYYGRRRILRGSSRGTHGLPFWKHAAPFHACKIKKAEFQYKGNLLLKCILLRILTAAPIREESRCSNCERACRAAEICQAKIPHSTWWTSPTWAPWGWSGHVQHTTWTAIKSWTACNNPEASCTCPQKWYTKGILPWCHDYKQVRILLNWMDGWMHEISREFPS